MKIDKPVRDQTFAVTVTAEEKAEIFRRAREADRTVSGYIRWLIKTLDGKKEADDEDDGK